jgi:hypothetical protein
MGEEEKNWINSKKKIMLELLHIKMEEKEEIIWNPDDTYDALKHRVDIFYPARVKEQKQYVKNLFKYVNKDIAKIELLVKEEFGKAVEKVDLKGTKIIDYRAEYNKESKNFEIEVIKILIPNRKHTLESVFASRCDSRLFPEIREFRDKYDVCSIKCNIKGIEYAEENK